jgi:hypothetical protein
VLYIRYDDAVSCGPIIVLYLSVLKVLGTPSVAFHSSVVLMKNGRRRAHNGYVPMIPGEIHLCWINTGRIYRATSADAETSQAESRDRQGRHATSSDVAYHFES